MLAAAGEICIAVSWEESTVIVAFPLTDPSCAEMVELPPESAVTRPPVLTLATVGADEIHVTALVITCVLPSLNVPVATQFTDVDGASTAVAGVTEMEESVAELTLSGAEPKTPRNAAEMLAVPGPIAVAVLPAFPIVATARLSEAHVDSRVMTWVLLSLNKPTALKGSLVPGAMVRPEGLTEMDTSVAFVTSSMAEALMEPSVAVIVEVPGARALARPLGAIVATAVLDEAQDTFPVRL